MSEYQPGRTMLEENVYSDVDGNPRYSEFGKAIKAESVEDLTSSIHVDIDSGRKEQSPQSFPPPLPPRSAKTQQRKPTTKQKEVSQLHSSENSVSKKRPKGGNFEEIKTDLTQQDYKQVNEAIILDEECHVAVSVQTKIKTNNTSSLEKNPDSINILPRSSIIDDFQRISRMTDAVKEAYIRERYTNCKLHKPFGTIKEETDVKDNSYVPMTYVKNETKTMNNIDKCMGSAGKEVDIKCNVHLKIDSDEDVKENDENGYMLMRYVRKGSATVHVISPEARRKAKNKPFKSLSKRQLVRRLEECGLKDLATVCENENLDGQFLEKHVSNEDLMQDPFLLTRFQIIKLRAIIDGWRPISDFLNDVDSASD